MGLSREQRQALLDRAAGLRAEVTSAESERTDAEAQASQDRRDLKLIAEVQRLERQKEVAEAGRDQAVGTVEAAAAIMEAAASGVVSPAPQQAETVQEASPVTRPAATEDKGTLASASLAGLNKGVGKGTRTATVEGTEVN